MGLGYARISALTVTELTNLMTVVQKGEVDDPKKFIFLRFVNDFF